MNDEIIIRVIENEGKNLVFTITFFTDYLQSEPEMNAIMETFFGVDFFTKQISEAENTTTFIIETTQQKIIAFFNRFGKVIKHTKGDNGIMDYAYDNKN
jgi:hypothetical protein